MLWASNFSANFFSAGTQMLGVAIGGAVIFVGQKVEGRMSCYVSYLICSESEAVDDLIGCLLVLFECDDSQ